MNIFKNTQSLSTGYLLVAAYVAPFQQKVYQKVGGFQKVVKKGVVLWKKWRFH